MSRRLMTLRGDRVLTALWENGHITECTVDDRTPAFIGRIYVARVEHIVNSINGAFLTAGSQKLYYSLKENPLPVFAHSQRQDCITVGDEIVVQVTREALKTKEACAGSALQISGRYCVVMAERTGRQPKLKTLISRKIENKEFRERMLSEKPQCVSSLYECASDFGFGINILIRTNAAEVEEKLVLAEIEENCKELEGVLKAARYRSSGSLLWQPLPAYISTIRDTSLNQLESIVCDDEELLNEVKNALEAGGCADGLKYSLYKDKAYPMSKCYNLDSDLEKAMNKQVWLSSGAYLVIEQTEALVAIDVNTGKAVSGHKKESQDKFFYRVNLEAAKEIMYQLRLRNLSGMILVDFISMTDHSLEEALMNEMQAMALRDSVYTRIVDMTALGLVEITRKKLREPLDKQLRV